jgi:gluconolactonase
MFHMMNAMVEADGRPAASRAVERIDPVLDGLVPASARLLRLATGATWSEGPVWLPADGSVLWSDIPGNRILRWHPDGRADVFADGVEFENGHTLDLDGSVIACSHGERRIERLHPDGSRTAIVDRYRGARLNSPNDVVVKSDGTIWFSDPPYGIASDREGHQSESEIGDCLVFRFDPATGELDAVTDIVEEPNGLAFSPDETVLYVADTSAALRADGSGNRHIMAFDVLDGRRLANPRVFYALRPDQGLADGFRVDEHGNVFTSAEDGIHVVAADGRLLGRIPVPERTSNCVFGGPDGTRLFITAGTSLYAIDLATRGAVKAGRA